MTLAMILSALLLQGSPQGIPQQPQQGTVALPPLDPPPRILQIPPLGALLGTEQRVLEKSEVAVKVTAELRDGREPKLVFHIRSEATKDILYHYDNVPWRWPASATIIMTTLAGEELRDEWPIEDPGSRMVELRPGEELSGTVDLNSRFPSLRKWRRRQPLLLFWSYQFEESPRAGGWALLPAGK
jgi:hypothetical protein